MDSTIITPSTMSEAVIAQKEKDSYASMVDPFLVEALQNPRHRLTILRMELDIQKFLQNSDQHQFEFQHFPTSYLRLAAHRVAQHYGLQTMVLDNFFDGQGNRIVVTKIAEIRYPAVRLSDIPAKQAENDKQEQIKVVIRPRPCKTSSNDTSDRGIKRSPVRTVEERKEEYEKARARIFSSPGSPESEGTLSRTSSDGKNLFNGDDNEVSRNSIMDFQNGACSRVAVLRDREKDRTDPDYDRSYERYIKNMPTGQSSSLMPFSMQKFQHPYLQHDSVFPKLGQVPRSQVSIGYGTPVISPYCAAGSNQTTRDAAYMQWPSHAMMYGESYDQFRHVAFQAPFFQQGLSFDYSQNY